MIPSTEPLQPGSVETAQVVDPLSIGHLQKDLKGRSARGGVLTLTAQAARFILQTGSTIVLARLLSKEDFGLVAMVTAITTIGNVFADVGLSEATIQRDKIDQGQVSTLFWINVAVGFVLMMITIGLAPVLAWFYGEPRLLSITLVTSLSWLIAGLRVQHDALLKRQMRYKSMATRDIIAFTLATLVAVATAWSGGGYWAVVILPLTLNFIQMVLSWFMINWRPGWPKWGVGIKPMLKYGANLSGSNFATYLNRYMDNVLIGWYWGAGQLGLYSRAYNLLTLPVRQLNAPIRTVAIPLFSRIAGDPERFARYYLRMANLIVWLSAPLIGFLFVAAEPVVVLTLGKPWREAAGVFQVLAISAMFQPIWDTTEWVLASRGQTNRLLRMGLTISPIIVASFAIGLPWGIRAVALSYSLVVLALLPLIFKYTFRGTLLNLRRLAGALVYPLTTSIVAVVFSLIVDRASGVHNELGRLMLIGSAFAAVFGASMLVSAVRAEVLSLRNAFSSLKQSN